MKNPLPYLLFVILDIFVAVSQAQGPYTGVHTGVFRTGDFDSWGVGATMGYELCSLGCNIHQSIEAEVLYLSANDKNLEPYPPLEEYSYKDEIDQIPVFFNYKLSGPIYQSCLNWYLGAGIGFNHIQYKASKALIVGSVIEQRQEAHSTTIFAAQAFLGLSYPIFNRIWLDIEGKLMNMKKLRFRNPENETKSVQAGLEIGLTYHW